MNVLGRGYMRIASICGRFPYIVCEQDGHIVGFCYAHEWKERAAYGGIWETTEKETTRFIQIMTTRDNL